jgi:hypothetical protein
VRYDPSSLKTRSHNLLGRGTTRDLTPQILFIVRLPIH